MKFTVTVGEVVIKSQGLDLTARQLRDVIRLAASIALALPNPPAEPDQAQAPIGFTAHIERNTESLVDYSEWFEEEE
jgi:hypothetical protein